MTEPRAIRLTFSYEGTNVRLESMQRLQMRALPSADLTGYQGSAGFWVQVQDDEERVLHRLLMHHPMRWDREIYPEREGENFSRAALAAPPRGSFDVVIPDIPTARAVSVYASLPARAPAGESDSGRQARLTAAAVSPAREVARFPLPDEGGQ